MRVLGICHSIMYQSCKTQTPITFGLGIQVHHDHGSRELIYVLSTVGHCINYDDVRKFLASVALDQLSETSEVHIPRGISQVDTENLGTTVDAAIDDFDQNEETIDGKRTAHAMAIVLYQRCPVTHETSSIACMKQKSLDTVQYKSNNSNCIASLLTSQNQPSSIK